MYSWFKKSYKPSVVFFSKMSIISMVLASGFIVPYNSNAKSSDNYNNIPVIYLGGESSQSATDGKPTSLSTGHKYQGQASMKDCPDRPNNIQDIIRCDKSSSSSNKGSIQGNRVPTPQVMGNNRPSSYGSQNSVPGGMPAPQVMGNNRPSSYGSQNSVSGGMPAPQVMGNNRPSSYGSQNSVPGGMPAPQVMGNNRPSSYGSQNSVPGGMPAPQVMGNNRPSSYGSQNSVPGGMPAPQVMGNNRPSSYGSQNSVPGGMPAPQVTGHLSSAIPTGYHMLQEPNKHRGKRGIGGWFREQGNKVQEKWHNMDSEKKDTIMFLIKNAALPLLKGVIFPLFKDVILPMIPGVDKIKNIWEFIADNR